MFWREYIERTNPWSLVHFHADGTAGAFNCRASLIHGGREIAVSGSGNGPIAAFVQALTTAGAAPFSVVYYREHALSAGTEASAIAYIQIRDADGRMRWGAGVDTNIELASVKAVLSALNRL